MNVFIVGICGKMGKAILERASEKGVTVSGGFDCVNQSVGVPVFAFADEVNVPIDVIIDFSRPSALDTVIELCGKYRCPCVLATTGYSENDEKKIAALSKKTAVFKSENMSLGVNALSILAEKAAALLNGFDIEIVERHHNQKADAPSGTAKLLCRSIERGIDYSPEYTYGREGASKRKVGDIGVHAVRGGTVVGEHEISFYGEHESVTLSHSAGSRSIFADGALEAAKFLVGKKAGTYDMRDLLNPSK